MSMYNMIHGTNPLAGVLLGMLGIDPSNVGRLRDCYLQRDTDDEGELEIHVYTRMGGGNRGWHGDTEERPEGEGCTCAGCMMLEITKHKQYLRNFDDDFDCTYATYVFSIPEAFSKALEELVGLDPEAVPESPEVRFKDFMKRMDTMGTEDPDVRRVVDGMKPVMEEISKSFTKEES